MNKELILLEFQLIKPFDRNPRKNDDAVDEVVKSFEKFGYINPIIVDENNVILAGHTRFKALKKMFPDYETYLRVAQCLRVEGLTEEQKNQYRILDNKLGELAQWDYDILQADYSIDELLSFDFKMKDLDYGEAKQDEIPLPPATPKTKLGDVYELGGHRIVCGDSTAEHDVMFLMGPNKADLVFTDPPYGVAYEQGKFTGVDVKKKFSPIANDEKTGEELYKFIRDVFNNIFKITKDNAPFYVWSPSMFESFEIAKAVRDSGVHLQSQIIWDKGSLVLGRADYHWQHEICWYGYKNVSPNHYWCGDRKQTTIWNEKRDSKYDHPTQKPTQLAFRAINNSSLSGNVVLDLFLGSGSTLIACEQTGRKCFGMELDPVYMDVIVQRYVNFTGNENIKLNGKDIFWPKS